MANALLAAPGSTSGSRPPQERPPVRLVAAAVVLVTSLGGATLAAAEGAALGTYAPALAVAAAAGLVGGISSRRMTSLWRRSRPSTPVDDLLSLPRLEVPQVAAAPAVDAAVDPQAGAAPTSVPSGPGALVAPAELREDVAVRTLRAQVHALEEVLEQVQGSLALRQRESMASEEHRRAVLLTVQAIADRTAGTEGARSALSRVAAAVERLGAPDAFARPVLPPVGHDVPAAPSALRGAAPVEPALTQPAITPPAITQPAITQPAESVAQPVEPVAQPVAALHAEPVQAPGVPQNDVVLPVPPRPVAASSHGRSWRRNRAS